ncbi:MULTISPECIES: IS5 family transposase [Calothrix]|uniref:IS5 family transposase n=2 Tax=Calothrix TaxID=1186 RepID=A0ABR8AL02_9CYAN|nr:MULTISPECIES: IS5 family transposase [Calothrix]MBD2200703.1 IS5 family transposase [Calothrix parietina FACHB-288]MBD2229747.1 IS5 family transposase [Calothrix anomala FACHB-343]
MKTKAQYKVKNWNAYDASLKQRGSITFWVNEEVIEQWRNQQKTGRKGASNYYSDTAIATMGTIQSVFHLPGRQAEGFLESLFMLMGIELAVPDHSTLSRRLSKLSVKLPVVPKDEAVHVVVDSTGVKVYGEGEWKVRTHGVGKRRTWRKLHLGVDEGSGEILAVVVTTNDFADCEVLPDLLEQIEQPIEQVSGDGGYDTFDCYDTIAERGAKATIPPRSNAKMQQHSNTQARLYPRDENLRRINQVGRKQWKQESGYHRRSLSETAIFRLKTIFGGKLKRRFFDNQAVELFLQCAALNRMIQLGKPDTYKIEN